LVFLYIRKAFISNILLQSNQNYIKFISKISWGDAFSKYDTKQAILLFVLTADLKKMFKKIADAKSEEECKKAMDPLMEIIMLIQFANDESDFGEGLELGLDLFCYGGEIFHKTILKLLPLAYQLLGRLEFSKIITEHLKDRKHSSNLSVL